MKYSHILTISLMVMLVSCKPQKAPEVSTTPEAVSTKAAMPEYKEVWMMQGWDNVMGVLIALKDKEYDYWFYSDAGAPHMEEPYTGTYIRNNKGIKLRCSKDLTDVHMYSKDWQFVKEDGQIKLAATDDLNAGRDSGRWLRKVNLEAFKYLYDSSDLRDPFLIQDNPHIEKEFADKLKQTEQVVAPDA